MANLLLIRDLCEINKIKIRELASRIGKDESTIQSMIRAGSTNTKTLEAIADIYLILKFESDVPRNALMLWAFFLGLAVDILSDTPGMNAAATVLLAFLRPTFLRLFVPRDTLDTLVPAIRTMGISPFLKYLVASVLVHHGMLLTLEFFSFVHIGALLLRIVTSTLLTVACIMAVEGIRKK